MPNKISFKFYRAPTAAHFIRAPRVRAPIVIEYLDKGIGDYLISGNASENGQRELSPFKTVGCIHDRYRLGHLWVPEMVLNVQSDI